MNLIGPNKSFVGPIGIQYCSYSKTGVSNNLKSTTVGCEQNKNIYRQTRYRDPCVFGFYFNSCILHGMQIIISYGRQGGGG